MKRTIKPDGHMGDDTLPITRRHATAAMNVQASSHHRQVLISMMRHGKSR
jgi:hypothetical protein